MLAADHELLSEIPEPGARAPRWSRRSALLFAANAALVAAVAAVDYAAGYDVRLATLYLVPIALSTWQLSGAAGVFMALSSTAAWLVTFESQHPYTHSAYFYWEGAAKAGTYLFIVWLVSRLRRALARSDERFVTVLEGLAAAVFVEDARNGRVLFANPRYRRKFGGAPPAMLPAHLGREFAGEVQDAASQRWYLVRSRPLRWVDGREVTLRLLSDITDEKRVRELMERHRDALHRSSRLVALGEFASAIAHEINQPLAAISTYNATCLRLLEAGRGDEAELRQAMQKCRDQAKRAGAIIQRLRELLRHPAPAFGALDLNAVAGAALQAVESDALQAGVHIRPALAPALPPVRADALLVEQVLLNLLRNAIDAVQGLPAARREVAIGTAALSDGSVEVSVSDAGPGVSPCIRERLFQPFATDKPGGLGLGLSICRSVIESHGGAIRCEDAPRGGARFAFTLPGAAP